MARELACMLCAALMAVSAASAAQPSAIQFLTAGSDGSLTYIVPSAVDLSLPFTPAKGRKLELYLSSLVGEEGDVVVLKPSIAELPDLGVKRQRLVLDTAQGVLTLRLQGPALPTAGRYAGTLAVLEDGALVQTSRVVLTRVPTLHAAKLSVEPKSLAVYQKLTPDSSGAFALQVRNADANWPAAGIFLRVVEASGPGGVNFDPMRNLALRWNGSPADDLWRSPASAGARSIAPAQQAQIDGQLTDLAAGEYTLKIGVGAVNAAPEGEQQVSLKLYVKHRWGWAFAVLIGAMLISFFATKGLETQRRAAAQLEKVAGLRRPWLRDEPAPLPTVAARAILRQVEERNRHWWDSIFGQDVNKARIDRAELLLRVMDAVQRVQARAATAAWDRMVTNRFRKRLASTLAPLDPYTVNADKARQIEAELGALEQWFDAAKRDQLYWLALKGDMESLMAQVNLEGFEPEHRRLAVDRLHDTVKAVLASPAAGTALYRAEEKYAQLKVLWERLQEGDRAALEEIVQALAARPDMTIEDFFRLADGIAWRALQKAAIELKTPPPTGGKREVEPLRAYDLILFELAPQPPAFGRNYLFKHGIEYTWVLDFTKAGETKPRQLARRVTMEPRVAQFVPDAGTLRLSVSMRFDGSPARQLDLGERTVHKSADYGFSSAFRFSDLCAFFIAMLFASITGLATYYFGKPAFGAIADYIALFVWGAGIDQTKNFIQNIDKAVGRA